jgi:hypothetical protein
MDFTCLTHPVAEELHEFIGPWEGVNSVNRVEDAEDEIT